MLTPTSDFVNAESSPAPVRPAARAGEAWHTNPYQRNSALDVAKRLVRASTPQPLSDSAVALILKRACKAENALPIHALPSLFETRRAFFEAVLARCSYRADEESNTPKRLHALSALTAIANLPHPPRSQPQGFARPAPAPRGQPQTPATDALQRWTGIDVRGQSNGADMTEQDAQLLWQACVKAAVWQRAVNAAKQPDAQPITAELINLLSLSECLDAAETWLFSQPSPIEVNTMFDDPAQDDLSAPDGHDLPDGVSDSEPSQEQPADPNPEPESDPDVETPSQFRARLIALLRDAGLRDLRSAFQEAVGESTLDAAIGKGLTRAQIEERVASFAESAKLAQTDPRFSPPLPPAPKREQGETESERFGLLLKKAEMFLESGLLPTNIKSIAQVVTLFEIAAQLGITPIAAITGIDVIQGRLSLKPQLMLALIQRSGQLENLEVRDDGAKCTVVMTRRGMSPHTESFSMDDAKNLGWLAKENWRKQPAVMRKWRAIAAAARILFADMICGL
jgi:hypothetical protein